ncbi:MAG: hypothetical protein A2Y63_01990 [Candidatus Riflebacteria bacterium RBG_13_59_9]|nr:MAG: hypothetical protein A2Y63_01990 [Candidatus Riflebacteria bacterium RBG_13_59_9]
MNAGRLCIENLQYPGNYFVYNVQPTAGSEAGKYISLGLRPVGANTKAVFSLVMDDNLYVSLMN